MTLAQTKIEPATHRLTHRFNAPAQRVFDALTRAEELAAWFGPEGVDCRSVQVDLRVGGAYSLEMHHADGDVFPLTGRYLEIDAPRRLVMSWTWGKGHMEGLETLVTFELSELVGATELSLTHEYLAGVEARDLHREGWSSSFECLLRHLR